VNHCGCTTHASARRIVLTGGPGAGKTAVLELVPHELCRHVRVLPESAGILFGGGFPRGATVPERRAAQRAIYFVQRELEATTAETGAAIVLCDRGTVDGMAYWPGPDDFFRSVGSTRADELARYDTVIHLRTPPAQGGYNRSNPLRVETAAEAAAIDRRITEAWSGHPRVFVVDSVPDFLAKVRRALRILADELPASCRQHAHPAANGLDLADQSSSSAATQPALSGTR
jgi:predicted ATPase